MPFNLIGDPFLSTILLPDTLKAPCCSTTVPPGGGVGGDGGPVGAGVGTGQTPHATGQFTCIYAGLASHSPRLAQYAQSALVSRQGGGGGEGGVGGGDGGVGGGGDGGVGGVGTPPQLGALAEESKEPVHSAQFEADR